ncbi:MAG: WD40 repeat domain-containing protein [Leptospiraceae bacterium]|nr:WD40 repeat domain-containing protein [Leptospiraceae bacterium]MCP5495864.1 WD40 repeat domain-containing protein [Leptospiraceae bacterium]
MKIILHIFICLFCLFQFPNVVSAKEIRVLTKKSFAFQKLEELYLSTYKNLKEGANWKVVQDAEQLKEIGIQFEKLPSKTSSKEIEERDLFLKIIYNKGQAYSGLKKFQEAISEFQYILKNQDTQFKTFRPAYIYAEHIAFAFYDSGEKKKALSVLRYQIASLENQRFREQTKEKEYNLELATLYEGIRKIYFKEKMYNKVLGFAIRNQKLVPNESNFFRLALSFMAAGNSEKAFQWFFKGLDSNQSSSEELQATLKEWEDYYKIQPKNDKEIGTCLWFLNQKINKHEKAKEIFSNTNSDVLTINILKLVKRPHTKTYKQLVEFFYYHSQYKKAIYFALKWNKQDDSGYAPLYIHFPYSLYSFEVEKDDIGLTHFLIGFNQVLNLKEKGKLESIDSFLDSLWNRYGDLQKQKSNNKRLATVLWFSELFEKRSIPKINTIGATELATHLKQIKFPNSELLYDAGVYFSSQKDWKLTNQYMEFLYKRKKDYIEQAKQDPLFAFYFQNSNGNMGVERQIKLDSGKTKIIVPVGHKNRITKLVLSSDGKRLYSTSYDNTIKIWSRSGRLLRTIKAHKDEIKGMTLTPDGSKILSVSTDKTMKIRDKNGELLQSVPLGEDAHTSANSVTVSPNGLMIVTAHENGNIKLWNLKGQLLKEFSAHKLGVAKAIFSSDGKKIITASYDNTFKTWDLIGNPLASVKEELPVIHLFGSSISGIILAGTVDKIILYDLNTLKAIANLKLSDLKDAVFSSDGESIFLCDGKKVVSLNLATKKIQNIVVAKGKEISNIQVNNEKKIVYVAYENKSISIFTSQGKYIKSFKGQLDTISELFFISNKTKLVSKTFYDHNFKVWNSKGELITQFKGHKNKILDTVVSKDGQKIVTGSMDHTVKVWDTNGKLLLDLQGHSAPVNAVAITPDGKRIVSGSDEGRSIKVWSSQGKLLKDIGIETKGVFYTEGSHEYTTGVNFLKVTPDGQKIICASGEMVLIYSIKGNLIKAMEGLESKPILSLKIDPDKKSFYITQGDMHSSGGLRWDFNGNQLDFPKDVGHYIIYAPNKEIYVSHNEYHFKTDIKTKDGKQIKTLEGAIPLGIFKTKYGNYIFVRSSDKIEFYSYKGEFIKAIDNRQPAKSLALSPNKKQLLVVNEDNTIGIWDINTSKKLATLISFQDGSGIIYTPEAMYDYSPKKAITYIKLFQNGKRLKSKDIYNKYHQPDLLNKILEQN